MYCPDLPEPYNVVRCTSCSQSVDVIGTPDADADLRCYDCKADELPSRDEWRATEGGS